MFVKEGWMYKGFLSVFVVPLGVFFLLCEGEAKVGRWGRRRTGV